MTNEYVIDVDKGLGFVGIRLPPSTSDDEFIGIWLEDEDFNLNSPFKTIEDAELFAEIIVKLLNTAHLLGDG